MRLVSSLIVVRGRLSVLLVIGAVCLLVMASGAASSATPPAGFIDTTVVDPIGPSPTSVAWDPASSTARTAARFTVVSDDRTTAVVMSGTTSGPIVVTTPVGQATSPTSFTVLP
jgi:hypothetical protein